MLWTKDLIAAALFVAFAASSFVLSDIGVRLLQS